GRLGGVGVDAVVDQGGLGHDGGGSAHQGVEDAGLAGGERGDGAAALVDQDRPLPAPGGAGVPEPPVGGAQRRHQGLDHGAQPGPAGFDHPLDAVAAEGGGAPRAAGPGGGGG